MYHNKIEMIMSLVNDRDLYCLSNVNFSQRPAIYKDNWHYTPESFQEDMHDFSRYVMHGMIFLKREEAIVRYEEIRSLMSQYNDNRIYDAENGKLRIDVNEESVLKQYGLQSTQDGVKMWTIRNVSGLEDGTDEWIIKDGKFEPNFHPAALFVSKDNAQKAYKEFEKLLNDIPHPMDYWLDGCGECFFDIDMKDKYYSCRIYGSYFSELLEEEFPFVEWNDECEEKMSELCCQESYMQYDCDSMDQGLYQKTESVYGTELVLHTLKSEWHFRNNMVLIKGRWVPIFMLFPMIGLHTGADIIKTFGIDTEQVELTKENIKDYIGRKFALDFGHQWVEDFVDEDTGEVCPVERFETIIPKCTALTEEQIKHIEDGYGLDCYLPCQVTFFVNNDDKIVEFITYNKWEGDVSCINELAEIITEDVPYDFDRKCEIVSEYMKKNVLISSLGKYRLLKSLNKEYVFNNNGGEITDCTTHSAKDNVVNKITSTEQDLFNLSYAPEDGEYVSPNDFIDIIKMLINKGEGYHPMIDNCKYLNDEKLIEIIKRRVNKIPNELLNCELLVNECFEVGYTLHCDEILTTL